VSEPTPPERSDAALPAGSRSAQLSESDAAAVDALIEANWDPAAVDPTLRPRAEAALRLFSRLDRYPCEERSAEDLDALLDATLARIDAEEAATEDRHRIELQRQARNRLRISDFVGVAAVFLLAISLAVPLTNHVRVQRGISLCAEGMRDLGSAFGRYADANGGAMPWAAGLLPGLGEGLAAIPERFEVSGRYRHGHHLRERLLGEVDSTSGVRSPGYCTHHSALCCPNHPEGDAGTYSYRVPANRGELMWGFEPALIIVGDRNPVIELVLGGQRVRVEMCSPEHADRGQNVLHGDGSVLFLRSPVIRRGAVEDNIWLPSDGADALHGPVTPVAGTVFLLN